MKDKTTPTPAEIRRAIELAQGNLINVVGAALGRWAGLGDWADLSAGGKRSAGLHALTQLDHVIADLTVARDDLNAALASGPDLPRYIGGLNRA